MEQKTIGKKLIFIGGLLLLLGAIGSNPNIIFGGVGGWVLMAAGVVVLIVGIAKRTKERKNANNIHPQA